MSPWRDSLTDKEQESRGKQGCFESRLEEETELVTYSSFETNTFWSWLEPVHVVLWCGLTLNPPKDKMESQGEMEGKEIPFIHSLCSGLYIPHVTDSSQQPHEVNFLPILQMRKVKCMDVRKLA